MKTKAVVRGTGDFEIEIDSVSALRLLCDAMDMSFFYDDFDDYLIIKTEDEDETYIYKKCTEWDDEEKEEIITYNKKTYKLFDERGKAFLALYSVAECIIPGLDSILVVNETNLK